MDSETLLPLRGSTGTGTGFGFDCAVVIDVLDFVTGVRSSGVGFGASLGYRTNAVNMRALRVLNTAAELWRCHGALSIRLSIGYVYPFVYIEFERD